MSIQGNINQMISVAGLLGSQSPYVKRRKEGTDIQARQEQAIRGLADIESNLKKFRASEKKGLTERSKNYKSYTQEELDNIRSRVKQYQNDIYDAKSAHLNPKLSRFINSDSIKQKALSKQLQNIYGYLDPQEVSADGAMPTGGETMDTSEPVRGPNAPKSMSRVENARIKANENLMARRNEQLASRYYTDFAQIPLDQRRRIEEGNGEVRYGHSLLRGDSEELNGNLFVGNGKTPMERVLGYKYNEKGEKYNINKVSTLQARNRKQRPIPLSEEDYQFDDQAAIDAIFNDN